jgi:hypothetical protein
MSRIDEIVQMVEDIKHKLSLEACWGCQNDAPSQKDHPCLWINEYGLQALQRLYGQGVITEEEYSEVINHL